MVASRNQRKGIAMKGKTPLNDKTKSLDLAMSQIEKQFGQGAIMRLGDENAIIPVETIPTGSLSLDIGLGVGGVPRGRIIEIFGPEGSGKTTLVSSIIAEAQKTGGMDGGHTPGKNQFRFEFPADPPDFIIPNK